MRCGFAVRFVLIVLCLFVSFACMCWVAVTCSRLFICVVVWCLVIVVLLWLAMVAVIWRLVASVGLPC